MKLFDLIYFSSKGRSGGRLREAGTASLPVPFLSLPSSLLPFSSLSYPHEHALSNSPRKKQAFKTLPHYDPHSHFQVIGKMGSNTHQGCLEVMMLVCKGGQSFYPQCLDLFRTGLPCVTQAGWGVWGLTLGLTAVRTCVKYGGDEWQHRWV